MVNLSTNPTDLNNVLNENNYISCPTSECSKINCNTNKLSVLHQNIRGITSKIDEFLISLPPNAPQVICLTEHHLQTEEIGNVNFGQYTLGSAFCRQTFEQGGVCIYISKNICFNAINLHQYIKEKDLEICALKLCSLTSCFTVICIYRSPTGDFTYFLNHLESILNKTYKTSTNIILCGDFNTNYLTRWRPVSCVGKS